MDRQQHILLVEDDRGIAALVERALRQNGFKVTQVSDGRTMDRAMRDDEYDLMLLDLMLPGEDGLSIARRIVQDHKLPIIMLTALSEETDRIVGLELGADDYVTKPFSSRELIARIRAVLRRSPQGNTVPSIPVATYNFAGWTLTSIRRELTDPLGVRVEVTGAEIMLLQIFCENAQRVLPREQLLKLTQGRVSQADDRSIDTLVSRLRRKIETDPKNPELFKTIRLGGYLFAAEVKVQ
jgi:two-component system, OmpR family, response regulator